jgi:hypothetical protein
MFRRLFIKLPLYILFYISIVIFPIPIGFWIITGEDYTDLIEVIDDL